MATGSRDTARIVLRVFCVSVALAWGCAALFAGGFHHHHDPLEHVHTDCALCLLALQPAGTSPTAMPSLPLPEPLDEPFPVPAWKPVRNWACTRDAVRAPPLV